MTLRRSARSASVKPASETTNHPVKKTQATAKNAVASKKRAASPERVAAPPSKRSKTAAQKPENDPPPKPPARKPSSKPASRTTTKKAVETKSRSKLAVVPEEKPQPKAKAAPKVAKPTKPPFNPLPTPPAHERPGLQLFVWGAGNFGQFGMGPDELGEFDKPKKNPWIEEKMEEGAFGEVSGGLESVVAGGLHSLMVDEQGAIWSCGVNDDAALGRITQEVPDPANPGSFLDVDTLMAYPHPLKSLVDENFRAVQIVSGDSICAAVSAEGELKVWGSFRVNEGSLGFADGRKHQFEPTTLMKFDDKTERVSSLAAGSNHMVVLTTLGNIYTWGAGEQAQLGRKVLERRKIHGTVPEKVTLGSRSRKAVHVGAGTYHSFAVSDSGEVWAWGLNSMGQTGTGFFSEDDTIVQHPTQVPSLSKDALGGDAVVQIVGGEHHSVFLTASGKVYACGRSNGGQLGLADDDAAFEDRPYPDFIAEPALVTFPNADDPVVQIAAGSHNNMAVTRGGALYCWGQGTQGELGVPDEVVKTPRMIVRKEGGSWKAVQVSCGGQHTLGLFRKKVAA